MAERRSQARRGEPMSWLLEHMSDAACAVWPFAVRQGYGWIRWQGSMRHAHTVATVLRDGPAPPDAPYAIHGPCHNTLCISHARWGSQAENESDKRRDGTTIRGERNGQSKLTADQVRLIRASTKTNAALGRDLGVTETAVRLIRNGQRWGHVQ